VYASVSEKAKARFDAGETNRVEASSSQAQLQQLRIQEQQVEADIIAQQKVLNYLLNISTPILPSYSDPKIKVEMIMDTALINQHPLVIEAMNKVNISSAQAEVERNGLAPTFTLGYSNQSLKGWQSRDGISQEYFSGSDRFHIVQGGIAFPLFTQAAKAKIKAAETQAEIGKINASYLAVQLHAQLQSAIEAVNKWKQPLEYYEKEGAGYALEIREQSALSFSKGEINYIQWSMLMNQSYSITLAGLEALKNYNSALVELQYFLPSNNR
jgi:heavy metal efflux system protein